MSRSAFKTSLLASRGIGHLTGLSARVSVEGDALRIEDEKGAVMEVPAAEVQRLRLCRFVIRSGVLFETRITGTTGQDLLLSGSAKERGYGAVMRAFAAKVAEVGGLERVYGGDSVRNAVIILLLCSGSMTVLALVLAAFAYVLESVGYGIAAALAALLDIVLTRILFRSIWPRPVASLAELDKHLPQKDDHL